MTSNSSINKPLAFFKNKNGKNIIVFFLIIFLGLTMAARKQFIIKPYENYEHFSSISASDVYGEIHPLYAKTFYTPPALALVPKEILFQPWFHVFSAISFWILVIGGVFVLIKKSGLTTYQSMVITLFTLFVGGLIIRELFDITLLAPSPYAGYRYYSIRIFVVPLSILCLIFMFNRLFFLAGILIGIATVFHIKFGFHFFGLVFFSLLFWKLWGLPRLGCSQKEIRWKKIMFFALGWVGFFIIAFLQIKFSTNYLDILELPRSQPLKSQLAWLIENEADDWLISYHFSDSRPFFGFLFMVVSIGIFCETIIRLSRIKSFQRFAIVWEIATLIALGYFGLGFLFESFLIDWLPLSLAHSISMTRFWDLIWVVVTGFWITFFLAANILLELILIKLVKPLNFAEKLIFHPALAFFVICNIAIFIISKDAELIYSPLSNGKKPILKIVDYVQICDDLTPEYNKFYWKAVAAVKGKNNKEFQNALSKLDDIYRNFKSKLDKPPNQNFDSTKLNILNHFLNGRYAMSIKELHKLRMIKGKDTYWWSCLDSERGIHHHSHNIKTQHYLDATDWIKANVPFNRGIIQPPYLPKFTMLSGHLGFWDGKLDQHLMYLIKGYYQLGLHRLRSVAGQYAWEIEPGTNTKGFGPESRWYFLNLNKNSIKEIQKNYPNYRLLLTENKNLKGYPVLYSNPSLILFDIS